MWRYCMLVLLRAETVGINGANPLSKVKVGLSWGFAGAVV